jgi:hypothetical protein
MIPRPSLNVVFVNFGTKYTAQQVNALHDSLKQYDRGYTFHVYTDINTTNYNPDLAIVRPLKPTLPKWWNKLAMFNRDFPIKGKILYFDIDTLIKSDPFDIVDNVKWDKLTMVDCHWKPKEIVRLTNLDVTVNSSVLAFDNTNESIHNLWDHFIASGLKDYFLRKYVGIDRYLMHEPFNKDLFDFFPHDYILSYKYEDHSKLAPVITCEELDFGSINPLSIT